MDKPITAELIRPKEEPLVSDEEIAFLAQLFYPLVMKEMSERKAGVK